MFRDRAFARNHAVPQSGEYDLAARRDLNQNAPSIALVGKTGREAKSFKRIKCAAYSRLSKLQRFGEAAHGVRSRIQRNTQENSGLSNV
jgi:hypothetical protein